MDDTIGRPMKPELVEIIGPNRDERGRFKRRETFTFLVQDVAFDDDLNLRDGERIEMTWNTSGVFQVKKA